MWDDLSADMDEDGKLIVAWQDNENDSLFIYLQQVDNTGVLVGGKFRELLSITIWIRGGIYPCRQVPV